MNCTLLSTIITPLCVSFRSNVLGSYSSSSLPSADEDSIRFMDDIEENIGADTAQGMYKNRIKNCRIFFFWNSFLDSSQIESQASVDVFETSVEIHPIPQEVTPPSPPKFSNSKFAKLLKNSKSSVTTSSKGHSSATSTTIQSSDKLSTPLRNYNSLPEIEGKF